MAHRVSGRAEADLDDIWVYVARESNSMDVATRFVESITDRFHLLSTFHFLGRDRSADLGAGARTFAVGEYIIIYTVNGDEVLILRVVHGRRDLAALFSL